ncbi:MAG: LysM peptidoglycan-binding domain-containing protein, partial [Gammaproteobacteria bacterium]|nr:LysM peptidoglycan-binding domain-containing protein [Gammaproteobacteria bacterium]
MSTMRQRKQGYFISLSLLLAACSSTPAEPEATYSSPKPIPDVSSKAPASSPSTKMDHREQRHTVKKGDTLWDIAGRFLHDPWRWPTVWHDNPGITNPHLIYPGDELRLYMQNGQPRLTVSRRQLPVVRLSPRAHKQVLQPQAVPTIDMVVLDKFLKKARVVSEDELKAAPYILGGGERRLLGGSAGDEVYVKGLENDGLVDYAIYKKGVIYHNDDDDVIGHELVHVADARLLRYGKLSV